METADGCSYDALVDALYFLRSLCECLLDADPVFLHSPTSDFDKFLSILLPLQAVDRVAVMKYWTAWPMARWLRNDVPERPKALVEAPGCDFPIAGRGRRHFRNLLASRTTEVRPGQVFLAILQGVKRGCAPVREEFEILSCQKHKKALTQTIPTDGIEVFEEKFDQCWDSPAIMALGSKRREAKLTQLSTSGRMALKNPSFHATIERKRSGGGRAANIFSTLQRELLGNEPYHWGKHLEEQYQFHTWFDCNVLLDMYELKGKVVARYGVPLPTYGQAKKMAMESIRKDPTGISPSDEVGWQRMEILLGCKLARPTTPEQDLKQRVRDHGLTEQMQDSGFFDADDFDEFRSNLHAEVALCLEPLKCRVITKGESLPYWLAQTYQKSMWRALQDCPCFALTGQTVDGSHLQGVEDRTRNLDLSFDKWVSGDYSAATDGLSAGINQLCMKSLLAAANAPDDERRLCQMVLGNHKIKYPDRLRAEGDGLEPFTMQNGQLMGSILSFPVLCVINLAAYWLALEEYTGRTFRKEELPCLINGDDILFKSNDDFYLVWQKWIKRAGFSMSVGKNYISPNFITVNSESWLQVNGTFKKLNWLNAGLLMQEAEGPMKIPLRAETAERPLIPKLQWVLDNCVNKERTFNRLKHYWRKSISIWTRKGYYNLCAPVNYGGCGLRLPEELRHLVKFTTIQQKLAGAAHSEQKELVGCFTRECPTSRYARIAVNDLSVKEEIRQTRNGYLVLRPVLEPVRANERRFQDPESSERVAAALLNCQTITSGEQPTFAIKEISQRRINQAHVKNELIKRPFDELIEFRQSTQGPTDDVPLSLCEIKRTEMATEQISDPHLETRELFVDAVQLMASRLRLAGSGGHLDYTC
nr:MAG: putative RNA-dependent RNA polymerase [Narnaviridae sp.]